MFLAIVDAIIKIVIAINAVDKINPNNEIIVEKLSKLKLALPKISCDIGSEHATPINELKAEQEKDGFWLDNSRVLKVGKELKNLEVKLEKINSFQKKLNDLNLF